MLASKLDSQTARRHLTRRHDFQVLAESEVGMSKHLSLWGVSNRLEEISAAGIRWSNWGRRWISIGSDRFLGVPPSALVLRWPRLALNVDLKFTILILRGLRGLSLDAT